MHKTPHHTLERNKSADAIRGVAAWNVMNTHFLAVFFPALLIGNYQNLFDFANGPDARPFATMEPLLSLLYNGHFAVIIFFILSGFVLSGPFFSDQKEKITTRLIGRYIRLNGPIAAAIFFAFLLGAAGLYFNQPVAEKTGNAIWLASFYKPENITLTKAITDMLFGGVIEGSGNFNPPLWSLRIEMLGSLILLATLLAIPREHAAKGLFLSVVLLLAYFGITTDFIWILSLYIGASIHLIPKSFFQSTFKTPLFIAIGLYFGAFQYGHSAYDWVPTIGAIPQKDLANTIGAALFLAPCLKLDFKALHVKPLAYLGKISFSVYLLHFPVLCSLVCFLSLQQGVLSNPLFAYVVFIGTTFLLAHFFEKFVDRPSQKLANKFAKTFKISKPI